MKQLDKLILGSNPFEGVGYLSREQTRHYQEFFRHKENIIPILEASYNLGVKTFTASTNEPVMGALKEFKHSNDLKILPVVPNAYEYARDSTDKGVLGTVLHKAKQIDVYRKLRLGLRALTKIQGILSKDMVTLLTSLLDFELSTFRHYNVQGIILHGQVTDLALSSDNKELLNVYINLVQEQYKATPIVATHNFGLLLRKLKEWNIKIPVMGPVNKKGFMMKPSQEEVLQLIEETESTILAKKVLAGGRLTPEEALPFLLGKKIGSVVIGIGSLSEAYHTLSVAKQTLQV